MKYKYKISSIWFDRVEDWIKFIHFLNLAKIKYVKSPRTAPYCGYVKVTKKDLPLIELNFHGIDIEEGMPNGPKIPKWQIDRDPYGNTNRIDNGDN